MSESSRIERHPLEKAERNVEMYEAKLAGATWNELARRFDVTPEMVKKVVKREARRHGIPLPDPGKVVLGGVNIVDVAERVVLFEHRLLKAGATPTEAAPLLVTDEEAGEARLNQLVVQCLIESGWRLAVDDRGDVVAFAPSPAARGLN